MTHDMACVAETMRRRNADDALPAQSRAWLEIDLSAIRENVRAIRNCIGAEREVLAVVKADAYGHGMIPSARAALEAGAAWLGVAGVAEGRALRSAGMDAPIALLCHPAPAEMDALLSARLTPTLGDWDTLQTLIAAVRRLPSRRSPVAVHLEIDTGIGRSGVLPTAAPALWRMAEDSGLRVSGLCTHFANPDGLHPDFTRRQLASFQETRRMLEAGGARFDWIHVSGSAGTLRFAAESGNLVRPGLLLYGLRPAVESAIALRPALTLQARVATVRALPAGHNVSYGLTCTLMRPTLAATVLIGYGDGYPRRLSNCGQVLLHGQAAAVLGRVCMDQIVVDVTDLPPVRPGDAAVCIGRQGDAQITAESLAALIDTTEHEITTGLTARLPRIYKA